MNDKMVYMSGDATDEITLVRAGIKRAKALIAVLATDTDNVFLVLTARQLNPDIFIMARAGRKNQNLNCWLQVQTGWNHPMI